MSRYPSDWDSIRKRIYERDDHTCQECGATGVELHAHHKTPISQGGGHNESNLITLCKPCHEDVHGRKFWTEEESRFSDEQIVGVATLYFVLLSILIPPMAVLFIPMAILSLLSLAVTKSDGES